MERHTAFFSGPYDEAMELLHESRDYVAYVSENDQSRMAMGDRLKASYESMRVTSRLTQVMAWLLAQKAVHAGEITLADLASDRYALGGEAVCRGDDSEKSPELPLRLRRLLDASCRLYERVERLDAMVRRAVAAQESQTDAPFQNKTTRRALAPVG